MPDALRARFAPPERHADLRAAKAALAARGASLCGVEIVAASAVSVEAEPWDGDVALMLGNEGAGMSGPQLAACDRFVYVAQHGAGTASLNVAVAASIVLHRFDAWASAWAAQHCAGGADDDDGIAPPLPPP